MRKSSCILAVLIFVAGARFVESAPIPDYMPTSEVHAGLKGVGKTVFTGATVGSFDVEVLGVLRNIRPRGDAILARLSGGPLAQTGLISGMSGSPVYIGGKLIGAVAFGWGFGKEPIAALTPAEEMLSVMSDKDSGAGKPGNMSWTFSPAEPFFLSGREVSEILFAPSLQADWKRNDRSLVFVPIATPLMVSGIQEPVLREVGRSLVPFGLQLVQSGGGAPAEPVASKLEPGAALGVQLMRGDIEMAAIGTVTWADGREVVGFGHPLLWGGRSELPMTGGYVHAVLPSQMFSFKLSSTTGDLGTIVEDREKGIGGIIGQSARMVPVKVQVKAARGLPVEYDFDVIRHEMLTPQLAIFGIANAVITSGRALGETTSRLKLSANISYGAGKREVTVEDSFYSRSPVEPIAALAMPFGWLNMNRFEDVNFESISAEVSLEDERRTAEITSVRSEKSWVAPGEDVKLTVRLEPYGRDAVEIPLVFNIPKDAREGLAGIVVSDGMMSRNFERMRAPGKFAPTKLDQLIELIEEVDRQTDVVARVSLDRKGLTLRGVELPALPDSVVSLIASGGDGEPAASRFELKQRARTDYVVSGMRQLAVVIRKERTGLKTE